MVQWSVMVILIVGSRGVVREIMCTYSCSYIRSQVCVYSQGVVCMGRRAVAGWYQGGYGVVKVV